MSPLKGRSDDPTTEAHPAPARFTADEDGNILDADGRVVGHTSGHAPLVEPAPAPRAADEPADERPRDEDGNVLDESGNRAGPGIGSLAEIPEGGRGS